MSRQFIEDPLERKVTEACDSLWDALVDPREAYVDDEGLWWGGLGGAGTPAARSGLPCVTEEQLAAVRLESRRLAAGNEFAINGIENRISYLVGPGHSYRAAVRKGAPARPELVAEVQAVVDEFIDVNQWQCRQQEIVRRVDRDGEAFLRFFVAPDGVTRIRFVEPEQICAPQDRASVAAGREPRASFGIQTDPDDVETPLVYFIDGRPVDAHHIQHRKANVDANVKRGLPLYFPVRKNLRRVEKLLRNMSALAEIQSAIALIRKHRSAVRNGIEQFVAAGETASAVGSGASRRHLSQFAPARSSTPPAALSTTSPPRESTRPTL